MTRLFHHLGHPNGVLCGVEVCQSIGVQIELIAQNQYQMSQRFSHVDYVLALRWFCFFGKRLSSTKLGPSF
jgi:hypothetical protein